MFGVRHASDPQAAQVWKHLTQLSWQDLRAETATPLGGVYAWRRASRDLAVIEYAPVSTHFEWLMEFWSAVLTLILPTHAFSSCATEPCIHVRVGCDALRDFFTGKETRLSVWTA